MRRISIGIDTSNYKTSVATVDIEENILCNLQRISERKKRARGLRQSVALFQHVNNLPDLLTQLFETLRAGGEYTVDCIAVSEKPRTVEGSYMPCFQAGLSAKKESCSRPLMCRVFSFPIRKDILRRPASARTCKRSAFSVLSLFRRNFGRTSGFGNR